MESCIQELGRVVFMEDDIDTFPTSLNTDT